MPWTAYRRGRVLACNRAAEEIVALKDGLDIDEDGLSGSVLSQTRRLRLLIHQAAMGEGQRGGSVWLTRPSGDPELKLLVTSFAGAPLDGGCAAAVLIDPPTRAQSPRS